MEILNLKEIEKITQDLYKKLPEKIILNSFVTFGKQEDLAKPNVEIDYANNYNFIIIERGEVLENRMTSSLDELLSWIFETITFGLASNFELKNRNLDFDSRRILFNKQEEFLGKISDNWKLNKKNEHIKILKTYPFKDKIDLINEYRIRLQKTGFYNEEILDLMVKKYSEIKNL